MSNSNWRHLHPVAEILGQGQTPGLSLGMGAALCQSPRSWFGTVNAVAHDCPESPRGELDHLLALFAETSQGAQDLKNQATHRGS